MPEFSNVNQLFNAIEMGSIALSQVHDFIESFTKDEIDEYLSGNFDVSARDVVKLRNKLLQDFEKEKQNPNSGDLLNGGNDRVYGSEPVGGADRQGRHSDYLHVLYWKLRIEAYSDKAPLDDKLLLIKNWHPSLFIVIEKKNKKTGEISHMMINKAGHKNVRHTHKFIGVDDNHIPQMGAPGTGSTIREPYKTSTDHMLENEINDLLLAGGVEDLWEYKVVECFTVLEEVSKTNQAVDVTKSIIDATLAEAISGIGGAVVGGPIGSIIGGAAGAATYAIFKEAISKIFADKKHFVLGMKRSVWNGQKTRLIPRDNNSPKSPINQPFGSGSELWILQDTHEMIKITEVDYGGPTILRHKVRFEFKIDLRLRVVDSLGGTD